MEGQTAPAGAEAASVRFVPGSVRLGLGGLTRPGAWTPLRVELENPTGDDRDLTLSWWLPDAAGDRVQMRRQVAVPAGRTTAAWLYGVPVDGPAPAEGWPVVATDAEGAVAASANALPDPARRLLPGEELILRMSASDLGLSDYARSAASHAKRRLVGGVPLDALPDRVQGLLGVSAIVWAVDGGGNPAAAGVPVAAVSAWVRRGGHLVIVLPSVGERWTQSAFAPLLPLSEGEAPRRGTVSLPDLGVTRPPGSDAAPAWILPEPGAGGGVLLRARGGEPLVASIRRGFGEVTLIGLDLSAPLYRGEPLPSGTRRLWNDIFGWSDPALSERREKNLRGEASGTPPEIKPARELPGVEIGAVLTDGLGLRGSVSLALGTLLLLLVLLPVAVAGSWAWARLRGSGAAGPLRAAWPVFAVICLAGAVLGWMIALTGRPDGPSARHQSVVDLDPASGARHTRSRVSLFVPGFGRAAVRVGEAGDASTLLSTEGLPGAGGSAFLDPQSYTLDAADPAAAEIPLRSTTRALRIDQARDRAEPAARRVRLRGRATHRAGTARLLKVSLESSLPSDLRDVLLVYCPGEGYDAGQRRPLPPLAWRYEGSGTAGVWAAGSTLEVAGVPDRAVVLAELPPLGKAAVGFRAGGWLNTVLEQSGAGAASSPEPGAVVSDPVRAAEALSFFGRLPAPAIEKVSPPLAGRLDRSLSDLVGLDLSELTSGPRLIVLGHADGATLPLPLTVNGIEPPSEGRTLYRVIVDLEDDR